MSLISGPSPRDLGYCAGTMEQGLDSLVEPIESMVLAFRFKKPCSFAIIDETRREEKSVSRGTRDLD